MKKINNNHFFVAFISLFLMLTACQPKQAPDSKPANPNEHKVVVKDVVQVTKYTYMLVKENDKDNWIAVPKMEAKVGDTYYYYNGMVMTNFQSKDLGKTFDEITFVDKVTTQPVAQETQNNAGPAAGTQPPAGTAPSQDQGQAAARTPQKPVIEKVDVKVDKAPGGITIANLYEKKANFENKTVKIKGQVTKVNTGIMGKNWIHIQDGTSYGNNIDLTVTTNAEFKVGDKVTFEGKISLKKDFGYGYSYEVIMEDAIAK